MSAHNVHELRFTNILVPDLGRRRNVCYQELDARRVMQIVDFDTVIA
jgi:hypothetical protein